MVVFLYEVTETFVQFFRKYHDVFAKTSLRYKKHVFYLFSALSITVFGVESESVKGMFFRSLFSFAFKKKRYLFGTDILHSKGYKKRVRIDEVMIGLGHFHHPDSFSLFI